jgi:hypothetical protein
MPLDHSQVRNIINANIKKMRWAMQLQDWRIGVSYLHLDGDLVADCRAEPGCRRAFVRIDCDKCEDEHDVLDTLRHELLHVFHAEMWPYRQAVARLVEEHPFDAIDESFQQATELIVTRMEQMLDHGLKIGVAEMCKIGGADDGTGRQDG